MATARKTVTRNATALQRELRAAGNANKGQFLIRFFKCGPGEYAEGDKFLGISVPEIRRIVHPYRDLSAAQLRILMRSPWHEIRLGALIILNLQTSKTDPERQRRAYRFYLQNMRYVNNWDLVDVSASNIVGPMLDSISPKQLQQWVRSENLWYRRIAMVATFWEIRQGEFKRALAVAEQLRDDEHDLIHKAVGWMLREIGKKDVATLERYLKRHHQQMPRTMLRYAIEKFSPAKRQFYMKKD